MSGEAGGGPSGMLRRAWKRLFGITDEDPAARDRRAKEEADREERYRLIKEAEDQARLQLALIEWAENISQAEFDAVRRRVIRERHKHKEYGPRPITWTEFYSALTAERVERERGNRA